MLEAALKFAPCQHRLSVHGHAVQIDCEVAAMNWPAHHALGEFATPDWPDGFTPVPGSIQPYDESVVMRHLSPDASAIATGDELTELYGHGERFWLVDDRWGLCEINFLKGEWRSWIVPDARLSGVAMTDSAVLWPLAQLLQNKGLTLLPAVSICRGGFGAMIISPFGVEPELSALIGSGWRIIGQRWTALREDEGRIAMLHMPGAVERSSGARQRNGSIEPVNGLIDLTAKNADANQHHAFCDAVIVVDAARRGSVSVKPMKGSNVVANLRRAWPIFELRSQPRIEQMPARLAAECSIYEAQFSRRADDFVMAMDQVSASRIARPRRMQMQILPARLPRQIPA